MIIRELPPPAAADCTAVKIDEHREDENSELRRQPVHENGAAPVRQKSKRDAFTSRYLGGLFYARHPIVQQGEWTLRVRRSD